MTEGSEWEHSWNAYGKRGEESARKLKNGKAAGYSSILPEMLKAGAGNEDFVSVLMDLMTWCGRTDMCHMSGQMPSSSLSPKKGTWLL